MKTRGWILAVMIVLAAFARLVPHPPNFAPICAMAFFGGVQFRSRWSAFLVPLAAMALSDIAIGIGTQLHWFDGWLAGGRGFYPDIWAVYLAIILTTCIGLWAGKRRSLPSLAGGVLGSSLLFWVVTNLGFWLMVDFYPDTPGWTKYPHTVAGLVECFVQAIPFYHWELAGDVFFSAVLFGGITLMEALHPRLQLATPRPQ